MKTEAVLFDLDGTLIDSLALIVRTYRKVFEELKIPWEDGDVLKMIGLPLKDIARHYTGELAGHFEELYQFYYQREHDLYTNLFRVPCPCWTSSKKGNPAGYCYFQGQDRGLERYQFYRTQTLYGHCGDSP